MDGSSLFTWAFVTFDWRRAWSSAQNRAHSTENSVSDEYTIDYKSDHSSMHACMNASSCNFSKIQFGEKKEKGNRKILRNSYYFF